MPLRDLLCQAPDVMLALKPCWATSPIVVSQVLPPRSLFDVVIFDEASQVKQADAIPPIMRARQVIVAGDKKQLPPTDFFSSVADDEDEESKDDLVIETGNIAVPRTGLAFESILYTLGTVLPDAPLTWHYRSRDERLITFSNKHFYEPKMTTFPGIGGYQCLEHVVTEQATGVAGQEKSVTAEVNRVVELILEHAKTRPSESLGVITLGIAHMRRIEANLEASLRSSDDLEEFFRETVTEEPFFIKNLERVQSDERYAIILSVGYGKAAVGRMQYRCGPLLRSGGERRLNVAVTRARKRITLVTSFHTEETTQPASRVTAESCCAHTYSTSTPAARSRRPPRRRYGAQPVRVGCKGTAAGRRDSRDSPVRCWRHEDLLRRSTSSVPRPDGASDRGRRASYHSAGSARDRDRLRQEHLERLRWRFHRIWSTDWFADPDNEVAKIRAAYDQAIIRSEVNGHHPGRATMAPSSRPQPDHERAAPQPARRLPQPWFQQGLTIDQYSQLELAGSPTGSRATEYFERKNRCSRK